MIKMTMLGRDSGRHSHSLSFELHLHWRHIITITIIIFLGRRHRRYCVGARTPHRGDITIMIIVLIAHRHHGQIKGFLASHGHRATSASEVYALLRLLLPHLLRGSQKMSSSQRSDERHEPDHHGRHHMYITLSSMMHLLLFIDIGNETVISAADVQHQQCSEQFVTICDVTKS